MLFIKDYDRRLVSISSRQAGGAFLADTKYDTIESARDFLRRFDASDVWFRAALVDEALGTSDSSLLGMSERDLIDTAARGIAAGRIVVATAIARPRKVSFDPLRPRAHGLDRVKFPGRAATVALAGVLRFDRDLVAALQAALWHEAGDDGISRVAPRAARARTPQQRREAAAGRPPEIDLSKDEIARLLGDGWLRLLPVNAETGSYALAWRYPGSGSGSEEVDGGVAAPAPGGGRRPRPIAPPDPAPTPPAPAACSADTMKANLAKCDGGTGIWAKAKAVAGKEPTVEVKGAAGGFGGNADLAGGGVVIAPNPDCCGATQTLVFELTNLSNKTRFQDLTNQAAAGDLDREGYTRANERVEYDAGMNSVKAFNACKSQWGCASSATARHGFVAAAKDFDDYYDHFIADSHKNYYRSAWDRRFKSAYEGKHPTR